MYATFIAPTEHAPTALAVKRALLTFDKVVLPDPSDRDYFPPKKYLKAIGFPLVELNQGPVRPIAKTREYDEDFGKLLDEVKYGQREGLIDVVSTYDLSKNKNLTIGNAPDDFPLNAKFMLWSYRNLVRDNSVLLSAIESDDELRSASEDLLLAACGCRERRLPNRGRS